VPYSTDTETPAIPLIPVPAERFDDWAKTRPARERQWLETFHFRAEAGHWAALPGADGAMESVAFVQGEDGWIGQVAAAAAGLPPHRYRLQCDWTAEQRTAAALGWGLAQYRFGRYRTKDDDQEKALLVLDQDVREGVERLHGAQCLVRDLVNTPTEDLGPEQLGDALQAEADRFDAEITQIVGDDLLTRNFPAIHAVGRAAARAPRLLMLEWGEEDAPLLSLAGKGVCFDTGGLDLKPSSGMALMKKDMGGAAHVIALARLVMEYALPVRLQVLIPAVENAVSGNAYRPGDVIRTRQGTTVEIGNTDAEGRVVLADALALASEAEPDLLIDFATLTGAARVAMGPDIPPLFSNHDALAHGLVEAGEKAEDPLWRLPLYAPYRKLISSEVADINNSGKNAFAGCITAALFLQEFVGKGIDWAHIDTFAWNPTASPGRPLGGEALGLRAVFEYLRGRYG